MTCDKILTGTGGTWSEVKNKNKQEPNVIECCSVVN